MAYYDRANFKYHERTAHNQVSHNEKICSHQNCVHKFKTKKQKIMHHDKLDNECRLEKNYLFKLLHKFKDTFDEIVENYKLDSNEIKNTLIYTELNNEFETLPQKCLDRDLFISIFGKKLNMFK